MAELALVFGRIGILSFGGPAAQIALMHKELVEDRPWLADRQFLAGLNFCMLLPGPEAMQLATYAGWRLRGVPGGLIGGGLFVLPGALVIAVLAALYAGFGAVPLVEAMFTGVQAAVVAIVVQAVARLGSKSLRGRDHLAVAALSFLAIFALDLPFPLIVAAAGAWGYFKAASGAPDASAHRRPPARHGLAPTLALWITLWLAPIALLWLAGADLLLGLALFFAKLAVVTFGGAYAVLAYMAQEVVADRGWVSTQQMVDGLGLAETTPGPLILVTQFVGILAGFLKGGPALAAAAGLITLWVTFVPCFLWIFAGAPYVEWLGSRPRLAGALSAITAAVVGVIVNLSVWFAAHVFFAEIAEAALGPVSVIVPKPASLQPLTLALAALAALALWRLRWPLPAVLGTAALAGAAGSWLT